MIAASWIFDFQSHDISTLGAVPSGLPHIGFPQGITWHDTTKLLPTAASLFLVILAQSAATSRAYAFKYREPFDESVDLVGLGLANIGAGFSSTFVVNGSPTKTAMADEGGEPYAGGAAHHGGRRRSRAAVSHQTAAVPAERGARRRRLSDRPEAGRHPGLREILRLRKDEFAVAVVTAVVVVVVGVEQGIILAIVLSLLLHVRRHYEPIDVVLAWDEHHHVHSLPPGPGVTSEPGLVVYRFGAGIFYANAARLSDEVLELAGGKTPPRWFVLDAPSIDDIDFTGGKTLVEIAKALQELGVVFAVADVRGNVRRAARALRRDEHHRRRADLRHRRGRTRGVPRRESRAARRLTGIPRAAQSRPSPHTPVNESPGSSTIRSSVVRKAFGGQVIGSTARLRRSTSGSGSPVNSISQR